MISGTLVDLKTPVGFLPSKHFSGFLHEESESSIVVSEVKAPKYEMLAAYAQDILTPQHLVIKSQEKLVLGEHEADLFKLVQEISGSVIHKWALILGNDTSSVVIAATFNDSWRTALADSLYQALLTVRWSPEKDRSFEEGLNFQAEVAPFHIVDRTGFNLILSEDGQMLNHQGQIKSGLIIGASQQSPIIVNKKRFAMKRLQDQVFRVNQSEMKTTTINGLMAIEICADVLSLVHDTEDNEIPAFIYQMLYFAEEQYFFVDAICPLGERGRLLAKFSSIAQSFQRIDETSGEPVTTPGPSDDPKMITFLHDAFETVIKYQDVASSNIRRLLPTFQKQYPALTDDVATACLTEAKFLQESIDYLAPLFDGDVGSPFHLETALRCRYPGFHHDTYLAANNYARRKRKN